MEEIASMGAWVVGGCCGTTPEHIKACENRCKIHACGVAQSKAAHQVSSYPRRWRSA